MHHRKKVFTAILSLVLLLSWFLNGCAAENTQTQESNKPGPILDGPLNLGDKVPELTFTTTDGDTISVSEILEQKKLVVLNFWFENCSWCMTEFPVMEVAYQRYREDIEIIAVNPVDSSSDITAFEESRSYSFPMAGCSRDLALILGVGGYPTSVFIDREGIISLIHTGAILDTETFYRAFDSFTSDDYEQRIYHDISEIG